MIFSRIRQFVHQQSGVSLLEILISIGVASILLGFMTMNLVRAQSSTNVSAVVDQVISELKSQQGKAMHGALTESGSSSSFGIHFEPHAYVLYQGATYDPSSSHNVSIDLDNGVSVSSSPDSEINFLHQSGEITDAPFTITITNAAGNLQKTVTINQYGVVTSIQ